ncbi:MAG: HEAT repeat domain-containing protein [Candidatus Omnitrophota bacterium]
MRKNRALVLGTVFFLSAMQMLFFVKGLSAAENPPSSTSCTPEKVAEVQKVANELTALYGSEEKKITQELANARGKLFGQLAAYGPCAVPVLENDFWKTDSPPKRIIALYGFTHILKEKSQEYLFQAVEDPSRDVRIIAVFLLSPYKDDKTEDVLIGMLARETDESIKPLTMAAILDFNNSKALATVTAYSNDKDPKVQQAAKMLLARFFEKKAQQKNSPAQAGPTA